MKFSAWPNPARSVDEILELARFADQAGWFGFWFADHYMPNTGSEAIEPGPIHECWSILPAVAMVTASIRLGPLVSPTSVHHPALLANRAATVDHLSDGRMVLGLGAGWQINEHHAYGIDLEAPKVRVDRFEEAIQVVRSLLDNDHTDWDGTHYNLTNAPADPKPIQDRLPIVVGTGAPRMSRITARHADEWNTWGGPEMAGERAARFTKACDQVEVDPASLHRSVQTVIHIGADAERVADIRSGPAAPQSICGSDAEIVDQIGQLAELGFDEFIVPDFEMGDSVDQRRANYEHFAANIASQLGG